MTSWPPRIKYVADCIRALRAMEPTAPDEIYLTLSLEEFPGKEADLPADLAALAGYGKGFEDGVNAVLDSMDDKYNHK